MQLMRHLSDAELTELVLDREQEDLQRTLATLPNALREVSDRPEWFWQRQQAAIRGRIAASEHAWFRPLTTWVGALALIVLALLLLNSNPAPKPVAAQADPDQELLVAVEDAVGGETPAALQPAALLAEEISNSSKPAPAPHPTSKENSNED